MSASAVSHNLISRSGALPPVDEMLRMVQSGETLPEAGAVALAAEGRLRDLCDVAAQLRDLGKGKTVTFSPKVFIPLTRLCRDF